VPANTGLFVYNDNNNPFNIKTLSADEVVYFSLLLFPMIAFRVKVVSGFFDKLSNGLLLV